MNTTDYVTIDTAKLLKKAGYPQEYKRSLGGALISTDGGAICRPSLWDAMKWLREDKRIYISLAYTGYRKEADEIEAYEYQITAVNDIVQDLLVTPIFCDYYEADAGIAAACKWLIANDANVLSKTE